MRFSKTAIIKSLCVIALFTVIGWSVIQVAEAQTLNTGLNAVAQTGLSAIDPRVTVTRIIRIALGFLGVIAVCLMLYAGFIWMTAKGNEEKIDQAKKILTSAGIGLAIVLAAFGIASFILSRLLEATGGGGNQGPGGNNPGGGIGSSGNIFALIGTTPGDGMTDVPRNAIIRLQFTKNVMPESVTENSLVVKVNDESVDGQRTVSGNYVEFRPSATCEEKADTSCFPENATVTVEAQGGSSFNGNIGGTLGDVAVAQIDGKDSMIISTEKDPLACGAKNSKCIVSFTVGEMVDTDAPRVNLTNRQICAAMDATLEASAIDNSGVAKIDFYVADNLIGSRINNTFPFVPSPYSASLTWNASGLQQGQNVLLKATAYDLDSNNASAERTVRVSAGHCCNGIKDGDETGADCGGSCLACNGQSCRAAGSDTCSNTACQSGFCNAGGCTCAIRPEISSVTPAGGFCANDVNKACQSATDCGNGSCNLSTPNGATGNLVTITGRGFGSARGKIFFSSNGRKVEAALADDAQSGNPVCVNNVWSDTQVIAIVPSGAGDGPLVVESKEGTSDSTDDEYGGLINNFRKNTINRPGICALAPNAGRINDALAYAGVKMNDSEAYFGNLADNVKALASNFKEEKQGSATVPNLVTGATTTYVARDSVASNFVAFTKEGEPYNGPIISAIEPASGPVGQYVTVRGSGFGAIKGTSKVFFGEVSGAEADYSFPEICSQSVWTDKQIIVKVPAGIAIASYQITISRDGFAPVSSGELNFRVTAGSPNPGLCRIDPALGQPNSPVTLWGEYFQNKDNNSVVSFYNNREQRGAALTYWDIDQSAGGIKPWRVVTTVPASAATGPVKILAGSPAQASNSLNFVVGQCTKDDECGSGATCCAAGLPEAGKCKSDSAQCYGSVATSVYQWQFSTGAQNSVCAPDQQQCGTACCVAGACENAAQNKCASCAAGQNQCGDGSCCNLACVPGVGGAPSTCTDPTSCVGYNGAQCVEGYICPNSPGMCSPTPKPTGATCDCCCDKNQNDPKTGSNPGCCAGLTCANSCGAGPNLGLCSGCAVNGVPDDSKCNCTGTTGKFCSVTPQFPSGVCTDCASITDPAECSQHEQCCVDAKNNNACTSLRPGQPRVTEVGAFTGNIFEGLDEKEGDPETQTTFQFCGYFACTNANPNSCNPLAVKNGPYNVLTTCQQQCATAPIPCSGDKETCSNPQCPTNMRCDMSSCTCKTDTEPGPGEACKNPFTQQCTEGCSAGYQCLTPNYAGIGGGGSEVPDNTCRCCCKPPTGPNDVDTCKQLDPSLSCLANQDACTGPNRGACCGCTADSQCGDVATTGCGLTGNRCCRTRALVATRLPAPAAENVCRNPAIEAVFNQQMDIASFSDNVVVIGDYGNSSCPSGYAPVASAAPEGRFASALQGLKKLVTRVAPFLLSKSAFADVSNFCYVAGNPIGYDINPTQTKVTFRLTRPLDANRTYYVALKGDPALAEVTPSNGKDHYNSGIVSISKIGFNGTGIRRIPGYVPSIFNNTPLKNADVWTFKTGNDICAIESVKVSPSFYLFQKAGQQTTLTTAAWGRNNQPIQPIAGSYDWMWNWESANSDIAKVEQSADQPLVATATAGNRQDAQTVAKATATITADSINNPTTRGRAVSGTSQLRLFLCENPWPVFYAYPPYPAGYTWPWKDEATGIEFYYCRDKEGVGSADDLPALQQDPFSQPGSRKICMSGANLGKTCTSDSDCGGFAGSCWPEVLKEFFFLRETQPGVPSINGSVDPAGGKIIVRWQPTANATKYKIYYGRNPGQYTNNVEVPGAGSGREVSKTIAGLVNGLDYYFAVTALSAKNQETVFSNEIKLKPADTTPPATPEVQASSTDRKITLRWGTVPEAVRYVAYLGVQPRNGGSYAAEKPVSSATATSTEFTNLQSGSTYYLSLRAVDQYGNMSGYATEVSAQVPK